MLIHMFLHNEWTWNPQHIYIVSRASWMCSVSIITHKFMKQENLRHSHIFINGFSLVFFLFFCFLFIINGRTRNVLHWILVWIKIAMTSRQNSRPIIGNWMGEKWRVIIYFRKGSVNCRQNFNVKNNILLEANLFFYGLEFKWAYTLEGHGPGCNGWMTRKVTQCLFSFDCI